GHFCRPARGARVFVRAGDLVGNDRLDQRHRKIDLHVRRERRLRLHVRGDRLRGRRRLFRRPPAAGADAEVPSLARVDAGLGMRSPSVAKAPTRRGLAIRSMISVVIFVVVWEAVARAGLASPLFLPAFTRVIAEWWTVCADGSLP